MRCPFNHKTLLLLTLLLLTGCLEPYTPPVDATELNYLVVDGYLDAAGSASVKLSRTLPITSVGSAQSHTPAPKERNASVSIEDSQGKTYTLPETAPGYYSGPVPVSDQENYRLHIVTETGEEFLSAFVEVTTAPAIDSVYWTPEGDGIKVFVDTHDPDNNSRYYKWEIVETYQYTAGFYSVVKWENGDVVDRTEEDIIFLCYKGDTTRRIIIGTTTALAADVVSRQELLFVHKDTRKMMSTYSVEVRQKVLTREAYDYYRILEQTTENLGSLFDPMPVELRGNINNINNPSQDAVGFFSAGAITKKRIYVYPRQLPAHLRRVSQPVCSYDTVLISDLPNFINTELHLIAPVIPLGLTEPIGYTRATARCVDCRVQGGTTTKPEFWDPQ